MRRVLALVLITFLATAPGWGWWETGHRVVARIAANQLTAAARTRVARILGVADTPEAVADALATASTWADEVKKQNGTGDWHFIDLTIEDTKNDFPERCPNDNCLPARIQIFAEVLKEHPEDGKWSELDALRYLVHFVGDAHQPLHAISDADQGGNCEQLSEPFEKAKNLHALWDGGIIASMDTDDVHLAAELDHEIADMHEHQRHRLAHGRERDWIWESHELALRDVYYKLHIPIEAAMFPKSCAEAPAAISQFKVVPDPAYVDAMKPVVRMQLIKGGLRLARVLNEGL